MIERKFEVDTEIRINHETWRVAHYRMKYGKELIYTLQHEEVDGKHKTMELNEDALSTIIESGSKAFDLSEWDIINGTTFIRPKEPSTKT